MDENRDPLTGLWKPDWAREKLKTLVGQSSQVALLFIDIDRFSTFNCTYGHHQGDEELIRLAPKIEVLSGKNAHVCRLGGDEFLVILDETSLESARNVAEAIRTNQQPIPISTDGEVVDAMALSIGIAHFPTHASNSLALTQAADVALFRAKQDGRLSDGSPYIGRNRVMVFGDFINEIPERPLNQPK